MSGPEAFIGAGLFNDVLGTRAFIGAGGANKVAITGLNSFIGAGSNNITSGENSSIIGGIGNIAQSFNEIVLGTYNDTVTSGVSTNSFISTERLLVIGNGTADNARSNALVMLKNGNTTLNGELNLTDGTDTLNFSDFGASASNGDVLTFRNDSAIWSSSVDTAWNHSATQNILMNDFIISNDGDNEGLSINNGGEVAFRTLTSTPLIVAKASERLLMEMFSFGTGTSAGTIFDLYNSRGTEASRLAVADGDKLFTINSKAFYDASNFADRELLSISVDGAVSTGIVPTRTDFRTVNAAGSADTVLTLRSNGNVGIGNDAPQYLLHLTSASNAIQRIESGTDDRSALQFSEEAGAIGASAVGYELSYDGLEAKFMIRSANLGTIDTVVSLDRGTGYMGIQNHNPAATLDVGGAIKLSDAVATPMDGMIRYSGSDIEGRVGGVWQSLTTSNATCPTGFTQVGVTDLCIETNQRTASDWFDAVNTCVSAGYKLPTWAEWYGAMNNATLTNEIDDWEWVDDGTSNTARKVGNGDLKANANDDPDMGSEEFRCVFYRK